MFIMEKIAIQQTKPTAGLNGNALKLIAIIAMVLDHAAYLFLPKDTPLYSILRLIGRCTGPIMFYLLVEGYHHTSNINKYMLRMGVFALVSYLPYFLMINKTLPSAENFASFDVIYTLLLGLLALRARHEIKNTFLRWLVIGIVLILSVPADWYYLGIILILVFDYYYDDFNKQAFGYCIVVLFSLLPILSLPIKYLFTGQEFAAETVLGSLYKLGMFLPIALLRLYNGKRGQKGFLFKWGFYIFYPAHIVVLYIIYYFTIKAGFAA